MRKASKEEIEKAINEGIVFHKASKSSSIKSKVKTKARKKAYITGSHGSASAMMKAGIRKHRAEKSKRKD